MFRQLSYVYCIATALLLVACGSHHKNEQNVFRMNMSGKALESLDPAFAKDQYMMWTANMLFNTLVATGSNLHLTPSLAKSWDISDDGLTYTFHLRNHVYFHNNPALEKGRQLTASDVVYSFNRIIDPATASPGAWIFNDRIAEQDPFVAIDDSTFQLKLKRPFRPLLEILSMQYCSIVPHEVVEKWGKDFRTHPCGTGPFVLEQWDEGNMLILHRNTSYWEQDDTGRQLPYIDAVTIGFATSKATEFFRFLQGKLDFVNELDGSFKDLVLTKKGELKKEYTNKLNLSKRTYLNTEYLGFLTDTTNPVLANSPIKNVLVRRAMNYAIDRQKIVTYFRNGIGLPATSGFIPEGLPGYDSTHSYGYHYDPAKASALLAEAGYPGGKGMQPITVLTPDIYSDVVNFAANQLMEVGIPVKVELMQSNILRQQMSKSEAVFFRGQWIADYPDAETYLVFFNGNLPAPPNYTRFNNATFNRWYDEAMVTNNDTARWALYRSMDSLVMQEAPLIPLFYDQMTHFTQKRVRGFSATPMNVIDLKRVRLD
ncbi:MAG: ABC transporter substrate-binding protein [Chitinophagaceae bacterium]|nr:ABC transporter substrate-binding protein [Chitinophagaceae bacterium]